MQTNGTCYYRNDTGLLFVSSPEQHEITPIIGVKFTAFETHCFSQGCYIPFR